MVIFNSYVKLLEGKPYNHGCISKYHYLKVKLRGIEP